MTSLSEKLESDCKRIIATIILPTLTDHERLMNKDILYKIELLQELLLHYEADTLAKFSILTERRLHDDIEFAHRRVTDYPETDTRRPYWVKKLNNLRLLANMLKAWTDESIHSLQFQVSL